MAITFVNASVEASAANGPLAFTAPASPQVNDIWIAVVHSSDQVAHTFPDWTQVFQANGGGTTSRLSVWYFRYAGSSPNLDLGHTGGQSPIGGIAAFRGCVTSGSPVDTTGSGSAGTDASIELTGFTPTAADCMLVACDGSADDNNRSTLPTSFTATFEDTAGGTQNCYQTTAGTPDGSVACHYRIWTTGPTGNFTDTQAAADAWASVLIALKPEIQTTKTQTALARVTDQVSQTQTAKANITTGTTVDQTQTARARITVSVLKTQTAKANIVIQTTKTQSSLARITNTVDQTIGATARIGTLPTVSTSGITSYHHGWLAVPIEGLVPEEVAAAIARGDRRYMKQE